MPTKVRTATIAQGMDFFPTVEKNIEYMAALVKTACAWKPDIVCLPEGFATISVQGPGREKAQPVPGPITDAFAEYAREYRTYVICPLRTKRDGRQYNSAVILDRKGQVAGIYDKINPVANPEFTELEGGATLGLKGQYFDLDFGRVGIRICFDIEFPETWQRMEDDGVKLAIWPSAFEGGIQLKYYAYQHSYYLVSSARSFISRIIDPLGRILEETGRRHRIARREIDLDYIVCAGDYHLGLRDALVETYGPDVNLDILQEEGSLMVSSNNPELAVKKIAAEFDLVPRRDYIGHHREIYPIFREGKTPPPSPLPYAGREGYSKISLAEWRRLRDEYRKSMNK